MALERKWEKIPTRTLVQDGGQNGSVVLTSTMSFRVGMGVKLSSSSLPDLSLIVKRVSSSTLMFVGPRDSNILSRMDISQYTVADVATITAAEQNKTAIPHKDQLNMTLEREPVNARRVFQVDDFGNPIGTTPENPLHITSSDSSGGDLSVDVEGESTPVTGQTCPDGSTSVDVAVQNDMFTKPYNDFEVIAIRPDEQPIEIITRKDGVDQQRATYTYFPNGCFRRAVVEDL